MKKGIFEKRIPTVLAILILIGGLIITSLVLRQSVFTTSHATPNEEPQNIEVTNITDTSFTVTFTTLDPTIAGVSVQNSNPPTVYYDARNPQGGASFTSHFITVSNLLPKTTYSFSVLSNGGTYLNQGKNFTATTLSVHIPVSSASFSLGGKVLLPDGTAGNDVLILITIPGAQMVSAVTNGSGTFSIPTSLIVNPDGQPITLIPNMAIKLTATKSALVSTINYRYEPGANIPTISLSNNYSFTAGEENVSVGTPSSNLSVPSGPRKTDVKITVPKADQSFSDQRPSFQGTAAPNSLVKIVIHSDPVNVEVRSDPNGNWAYRPAVALSAGAHTITVSAADALGVFRTITTPFTVFASGSQVAEVATPSATIKPTATSTPTSTPTPTIAQTTPSPTVSAAVSSTPTPTLTPTIAPTATPTIIIPTNTPTPTVAVVIPPKAHVPPTGDTTQAIFLTTISILFIVSGSALLFIL
ncbi:MAG: Ig-like domain-containing protein [Candidatus Levyibacteriota bacterium]